MRKSVFSLVLLALFLPFLASATLCSTTGKLIEWFGLLFVLIFGIVLVIAVIRRILLKKKMQKIPDSNSGELLLRKLKRNKIILVIFSILFCLSAATYGTGIYVDSKISCDDGCEGYDNSTKKLDAAKSEYCQSVGGTVETYKQLGLCGDVLSEYCKPDDVGKTCTSSDQCDIACIGKKKAFNEQGVRVGICNSYEDYCLYNYGKAYEYDILFEETQSPSLGAAGGCAINPIHPNLYTTQKSRE